MAPELKNELKNVADDVFKLREAVETMQEFFFLRPDAHAVVGLQDWTEKEWSEGVTAHPEASANLLRELCLPHTQEPLGIRVRKAVGGPLTAKQWRCA